MVMQVKSMKLFERRMRGRCFCGEGGDEPGTRRISGIRKVKTGWRENVDGLVGWVVPLWYACVAGSWLVEG